MPVIIANIARWFVTLAPGYFFNDIIDWFSNLFGWQSKEDGKRPIWQVLLVIAAIAVAIWFLTKKVFKVKF